MNSINLLVSDSHGIYVPQAFVEGFDLSLWNGIDQADIDKVMEGPEADWYWEAWDNILSSAEYVHQGRTYRLHQDGDLWAIDYDGMTDDEYRDFFGEDRA